MIRLKERTRKQQESSPDTILEPEFRKKKGKVERREQHVSFKG